MIWVKTSPNNEKTNWCKWTFLLDCLWFFFLIPRSAIEVSCIGCNPQEKSNPINELFICAFLFLFIFYSMRNKTSWDFVIGLKLGIKISCKNVFLIICFQGIVWIFLCKNWLKKLLCVIILQILEIHIIIKVTLNANLC